MACFLVLALLHKVCPVESPIQFSHLTPLLHLSLEITNRFIHQRFFFPVSFVLTLFHENALLKLMLVFFILFLFYHEYWVA